MDCGVHHLNLLQYIINGSFCALITISNEQKPFMSCSLPSFIFDNANHLTKIPSEVLECSLIVSDGPLTLPNLSLKYYYHGPLSSLEPNDYGQSIFKVHSDLMVHYVMCPRLEPEVSEIWDIKTMDLLRTQEMKCPSVLSSMGRTVRIAYVGLPPFIYRKESDPAGVDIDLLHIFSSYLNFKYVLLEERGWLSQDSKTGELSGSIASVFSGKADVGVGNILINDVTFDLVQFPHYTYGLDMFICARKPQALKTYWNMLRPFPTPVWMFLLASFVLVWVTLVLGSWLYNPDECQVGQVLQWLFATLFLQTFHWRFNVFKSTKMLIPLWLLFVLAIDYFYESNLRAHLIAIEYDQPVDTVQDLLDRGMGLYLPRLTGFVDSFKHSSNAAYKELSLMYEQRDLYFDYDANGIPSYEDETKMYQQGDAMIINDVMAIAAFPEFQRRHNGTLPYQLSKTKILAGFGSIIVPHKAPYMTDLQRIIAILNDCGITQHLMNGYNKVQFQKGVEKNQPINLEPFNLDQTFMGLVIMVSGALISLVVFGIEKFKGWKMGGK